MLTAIAAVENRAEYCSERSCSSSAVRVYFSWSFVINLDAICQSCSNTVYINRSAQQKLNKI